MSRLISFYYWEADAKIRWIDWYPIFVTTCLPLMSFLQTIIISSTYCIAIKDIDQRPNSPSITSNYHHSLGFFPWNLFSDNGSKCRRWNNSLIPPNREGFWNTRYVSISRVLVSINSCKRAKHFSQAVSSKREWYFCCKFSQIRHYMVESHYFCHCQSPKLFLHWQPSIAYFQSSSTCASCWNGVSWWSRLLKYWTKSFWNSHTSPFLAQLHHGM